jgi:hypothetical protein
MAPLHREAVPRARICKRSRGQGIDSDSLCTIVWRTCMITLFVLPAGQATWAGGIDSLESIPNLLKRLKMGSSVLYVAESSNMDRA